MEEAQPLTTGGRQVVYQCTKFPTSDDLILNPVKIHGGRGELTSEIRSLIFTMHPSHIQINK